MALQENNLKKKLEEGLTTLGSAIFSWSPNMMEVAGYSGLDFIRIDTEHSWRRDAEIENLIRAAYLTGVVPIIRIDGNDEYLPRKAYEIGAGGIIATDIDTVEAAKSLVTSENFHPKALEATVEIVGLAVGASRQVLNGLSGVIVSFWLVLWLRV